jgi:hypothetical protein
VRAVEQSTEPGRRSHAKRSANAAGLVAGAATFAFLIPGAGRGYDLDSGLTVGIFVATRSVWDAFDKAYLVTNHVFFSFLDHLVYSATGSHDETVMRLLPIAMSAVAVGLLARLLAARYGAGPGLAGAAVLATNPLFAVEGSQVRGYSLVVVCAIVTTVLFLRALDADHMSTGARVTYAVVGAIGVATHLYMLAVLGIHALMSLRSRRQVERIALPLLGALLGVTAYIRIAKTMHAAIQATGRSFQPTFPRDLAVELLGGGVAAAIVTLVLVAPVAWTVRTRRLVQLGALGLVGAVTAIWLIGPKFLYPRFFLWTVPLVAVAVAIAVAKRPLAWALVLVIVGLQVHTAWPRLTNDPYPNRQAAKIFETVTARGGVPCATDVFTGVRLIGSVKLIGSKTPFLIHQSASRRGSCTVAFRIGLPGARLEQRMDHLFPFHTQLNAETPGVLWSIRPVSCWTTDPASASCAAAHG